MENSVVIDDYNKMDKILAEERRYILNMCNTIKKAGCNVLLIQKSILRDAVNDLSLSFLAKMGILVVKDVERDDIEFISKVRTRTPYKLDWLKARLLTFRVRLLMPFLLLRLNLSMRANWALLNWSRKFMWEKERL